MYRRRGRAFGGLYSVLWCAVIIIFFLSGFNFWPIFLIGALLSAILGMLIRRGGFFGATSWNQQQPPQYQPPPQQPYQPYEQGYQPPPQAPDTYQEGEQVYYQPSQQQPQYEQPQVQYPEEMPPQ